MTASQAFADWALSLTLDDVPASAQRTACRHLLDGLGVAIAASRLDAVRPVVDTALRSASPQEATVIGYGTRVPSPAAALANGALVHALDFDDTHADALVHTTAAVLPATFAVAEETGATGAGTLAAAVAAYEVVTRLGSAVRHGFHGRGFHATSVCGVFAAALSASKLYGLTRARTVDALGIAGSLASGSLEFLATGAATKQLHPGFSGMNGILAARLAAAGAGGPETIFEGEHGLFRSFLSADVDARTLTAGLGERWETERITIKPYPVCQLSQPALDALAGLGPIEAAEIDEITFDVPPESVAIVCEPASAKLRPRTPYEGKFSLPYSAASLVADGTLTVDSFAPSKLKREDVLALAARVRHRALAFDGAPADAPGIVEVRLRDGRRLAGDVKHGRGTPEDPLSEEELAAKFIANCGGPSEDALALAASLLGLDSQDEIGPVLRATTAFRASEGVR